MCELNKILDKIKEAENFYNEMKKNEENTDVFRYNLSAFLSAARSTLQFVLKEVKDKNGGKQWYNTITNNSIISFFKHKRDENIHIKPIEVRKNVNILIKDSLEISDSIKIVKRDTQGRVVEDYDSESKPLRPKAEIPTEITYRYIFEDWPGTEDILNLCQKYLIKIKEIIDDGKSKGFLI